MAVVSIYNDTDLRPNRPSLLGSVKLHVPHTSEINTSGTTNIFKLAMKMAPTVENIPSTKKVYVENSKPNIEKRKSPLSSNRS